MKNSRRAKAQQGRISSLLFCFWKLKKNVNSLEAGLFSSILLSRFRFAKKKIIERPSELKKVLVLGKREKGKNEWNWRIASQGDLSGDLIWRMAPHCNKIKLRFDNNARQDSLKQYTMIMLNSKAISYFMGVHMYYVCSTLLPVIGSRRREKNFVS